VPASERAGYLRGFAEQLGQRRDELIALQMRNNGKPRHEAEIDLDDAIATFAYYADLAEQLPAKTAMCRWPHRASPPAPAWSRWAWSA
jgi:betaine-aldehyde dehydrogenase